MQFPLYLNLQTGLKDTVSFHPLKGDASEKFWRNICIYVSKYDVCFDYNIRILLIRITFAASISTKYLLERLLPVSHFCSWFCAMAVPALALCASAYGLASHSLQHFFNLSRQFCILILPSQELAASHSFITFLHFIKHTLSLSVAGLSLISTRELHLVSAEGTGSRMERAGVRPGRPGAAAAATASIPCKADTVPSCRCSCFFEESWLMQK